MHVLGIILLVYPSLLITLLITASPSDTDEKREGKTSQKSSFFYFSIVSVLDLEKEDDDITTG